jgi:hypothetical protein
MDSLPSLKEFPAPAAPEFAEFAGNALELQREQTPRNANRRKFFQLPCQNPCRQGIR